MIGQIFESWRQLSIPYEVLFLEASDQILIKRYKETRRSHPLSGSGRIDQGIAKERERLAFLKKMADFILDTSKLLTKELRQELEKIFLENGDFDNLFVTVLSFGFIARNTKYAIQPAILLFFSGMRIPAIIPI